MSHVVKVLVRLSLVLVMITSACTGSCALGGAEGEVGGADAGELTRAQKDSLVSTLPIPGARGVGRALEASGAARARAAAHDSLLAGP